MPAWLAQRRSNCNVNIGCCQLGEIIDKLPACLFYTLRTHYLSVCLCVAKCKQLRQTDRHRTPEDLQLERKIIKLIDIFH